MNTSHKVFLAMPVGTFIPGGNGERGPQFEFMDFDDIENGIHCLKEQLRGNFAQSLLQLRLTMEARTACMENPETGDLHEYPLGKNTLIDKMAAKQACAEISGQGWRLVIDDAQ